MKDIMVDEQDELLFADGDFVVADSEQQNQLHLVDSSKGEYKRNPEIGANLIEMLADENPKDAIIELKKQLVYDGADVRNIKYKEGILTIDAKYK